MRLNLDSVPNFVNRDEKMLQKKEVRKMRKFLGLALVLGLMTGISTLSHATANPDSLTLTVTIGGSNYSIDIASTTNNFATVNLGAQKSLYIGTASNDGNVPCDLDCAVAATANGAGVAWTIANTVAQDVYGLMIATGTQATEPTWNPGASPQLVSSVTASQASMPYTNGIIPGTSRGLWTRLSMPTSLSGAAAGEWTITLSIWATAD